MSLNVNLLTISSLPSISYCVVARRPLTLDHKRFGHKALKVRPVPAPNTIWDFETVYESLALKGRSVLNVEFDTDRAFSTLAPNSITTQYFMLGCYRTCRWHFARNIWLNSTESATCTSPKYNLGFWQEYKSRALKGRSVQSVGFDTDRAFSTLAPNSAPIILPSISCRAVTGRAVGTLQQTSRRIALKVRPVPGPNTIWGFHKDSKPWALKGRSLSQILLVPNISLIKFNSVFV